MKRSNEAKDLIEEKTKLKAETDSKIQTLKVEVSKLRQSAADCREQLNSVKSNSQIISRLNNLRSQGRLPGYHGRLGDLGTIDDLQRYDVAISTIGYSTLDHIVVDDDNTLMKCINILKDESLGGASFINLNRLSPKIKQGAVKKVTPPENAVRLYDLINIRNPVIRPAFYFAVKETMVCESEKVAANIARNGFRVVTLNGYVYEPSGAVSGGGKQLRGKMSSFTGDPEEIRKKYTKYTNKAQELSTELISSNELSGNLEQEIEDLNREAMELDTNTIPSYNLDIKGKSDQIDDLENMLPELQKQAKDSDQFSSEINELERAVKKKQRALESAEGDAKDINDRIKDVQEKIANAGGKKAVKQRDNLAFMTKQVEDATNNLTKAEVDVHTSKKTIKSTDKEVKRLKTEMEELSEDINILEEKLEKTNADTGKLVTENNQLESEISDMVGEVEEKERAYKKRSKKNAKIRNLEVDMENELNTKQIKANEYKGRLGVISTKLNKLAKKKSSLKIDEDEDTSLITLDDVDLDEVSRKSLTKDIALLKQELSTKTPNKAAIQEYRARSTELADRKKALDLTTEDRDKKRKEYEELRKKRYYWSII